MERKEKNKNCKYPPKRIPMDQLQKIEKIGGGNWRRGLTILIAEHERLERDPTVILGKELDYFGNLVKAHLTDNHYEHYIESGLPRFLRCFIKTGKVNKELLYPGRREKSFDKFKDEEEELVEKKG